MKKDKKYLESLGLFLHPKFEFHLLIELLLNFLAILPIIGFFEFVKFPLVSYEGIAGIIIYIVVLTLVVESFKVYILRYFLNFIIKTKGILLYLLHISMFYLNTLIINNLRFNDNIIVSLLIFTTIFLTFKMFLIIVFQRNFTRKIKENDHEELD